MANKKKDPSADIGRGVFGRIKGMVARKDKDEQGDGMQKDPSGGTVRGVYGRMKKKFARKDKDVHRDGMQRIRCPGGITENDVNTYFEHLIEDYGRSLTETDKKLQVQALELLRTIKLKTFQNAELTIVGAVSAVRFVAGKGRRKFRIESQDLKTPVQVHIENLLFGFIRLVLFVAAMLEAISSFMSVASLVKHDSDKDDENPMSVTFFMTSGDVYRGLVGLLAAMETINSSISPFSSAYGRGPSQEGKTYGVGVWPLGPRRWLVRGLLYASVACRGRLHVLRDADFLLPVDILNSGQLYSGWILTGAALISVCLHLLHVPFPSLLKAPWTSITLPSHSSQDPSSSVSADIGESSFESGGGVTKMLTKIETVEIRDVRPGQEDRADGATDDLGGRCCRCCPKPWPVTCRRRPCTVNIWLQSVGVFLCLATAVVLFSCHVTRLVHSVGHQSPVPPVQSLSPLIAALLLCAVVGVCQAIGFFQAIMTHPPSLPLTMQTSLLLHAAAVGTTWSRDVVAWLTETCGWSEEAVGVALVSGSVTSLLFPALLRIGDMILARRRQPRQKNGRSCVSYNLCENLRELVLRGAYKIAVLLVVCGMIFAVISLPLPIARVQIEYTDDMLEVEQSLVRIMDTVDSHYEKLVETTNADLCGGPDIEQLKKDMYEQKQAAASLTVAQLKSHCDDMSWKTIIKNNDVFCLNYTAAKLFLVGIMSFNKSLHEPIIILVKTYSKKAQDMYLSKVISRSRGEQLKELDISDAELTPGAFKTREACRTAVCIAENAALVAMLIPFAGIAFQVVYLSLVVVNAALVLIIKLSKVQVIFLDLKTDLEILTSKLLYYREEKIIQFSLSNFNLIYLAYPALLTGCAVVLMGFWYRKGAPLAQRRRATMMMMLPLLFLNLFGLGVSFAWTHIVMILGEVTPMVDMTVEALSALVLLRISYGLTLTGLVLFLVLGFAEGMHIKAAWKDSATSNMTVMKSARTNTDTQTVEYKTTTLNEVTTSYGSRLATNGAESDSVDELSTLPSNKKVKATKTAKGVKITQVTTHHGSRLATNGAESDSVDELSTLPSNKKVKATKTAKGVKVTQVTTHHGSRLATNGAESDSVDELSTLPSNKKVKAMKTAKGVKMTRGVESRGSVWVLALVISVASAGLVTIIIWKPIFAFDYDLNADMKSHLKRVTKDFEENAVARLSIYDEDAGRCSLIDIIAKELIRGYMSALKGMVFETYQKLLNSVTVKAKVVALPSVMLIQIPLLLTSYLPLLAVAWSALMTKIRPSWTPRPRAVSRFINTMAWLSIGWLTSGVLFLVALAQDDVLPMFTFQVSLGPGFPYVMASGVMMIMSAQELNLAARSPIL